MDGMNFFGHWRGAWFSRPQVRTRNRAVCKHALPHRSGKVTGADDRFGVPVYEGAGFGHLAACAGLRMTCAHRRGTSTSSARTGWGEGRGKKNERAGFRHLAARAELCVSQKGLDKLSPNGTGGGVKGVRQLL